MRFYTMKRDQFVAVFFLFLLMFTMLLFLGACGPPITSTLRLTYLEIRNHSGTGGASIDNQISSQALAFQSPRMSPYQQQLWVMAQVVLGKQNDAFSFASTVRLGIEVKGILSDDNDVTQTRTLRPFTNVTVRLDCSNDQGCKPVSLFHLGTLDYKGYLIRLLFVNLKDIKNKFGIEDVAFYFKTFNTTYTKFEMWIRFLFVVSTFVATVWFYQQLKEFHYHYWSLEQRWIALLLPGLLLYNNPLFPLVFVGGGLTAVVIDEVFQATFLSLMLYAWLFLYHGIRRSDRDFATFYLPKLTIVGAIWFCMIVIAVWDRSHSAAKTMWNPASGDDTLVFQFLKLVLFSSTALYVLYFSVLLIRAYTELRNLPNFSNTPFIPSVMHIPLIIEGTRVRLLTGMVSSVVGATAWLSWRRYGVVAQLEDRFVGQLNTTYDSSVYLLFAYSLFNLYVYLMAWLYAPDGVQPDLSMKDGAAEPLIMETEEDLIISSEFLNSVHHREPIASVDTTDSDED